MRASHPWRQDRDEQAHARDRPGRWEERGLHRGECRLRCHRSHRSVTGPRPRGGACDSSGGAGLDSWLARLARQGPKSEPSLFPERNDRLAYYVNAYNALVFQGVLSRGPEKESVWKGGLFSGYSFFVSMKVRLDGETWSLKALEDDLIRKGFADPRIHAALNCASIGCPRLPREAFVPEKLEAQLDAAMREFVNRYRVTKPKLDRSFRVRTFDYDKRINGR